MDKHSIQVTKTYLPPIEAYTELLGGVWDNHWITNGGPLSRRLESELSDRLGTPLQLVSNGTVALQLAVHALELSGSVITTPYSYVATTNVLLWEKLRPVFVDVESQWYTLDPDLVEAAIRPDTSAILATHVYGFPCQHDRLRDIADRHGLALIYDAAHAFDIELNGQSILGWGDISTLSFHATKVFHTVEGGGVLTADPELLERLNLLRTFGHVGVDHRSVGINGKNTEFHAAVGLLNLPRLAANREARRAVSERYRESLRDSIVDTLDPGEYSGLKYNYAYFPVFCPDAETRELINDELNAQNIFPRRYFAPSLNELSFLEDSMRASCPISERAADTVLCLPLYPELAFDDVDRISGIIHESLVKW